jgi:two-component sensor histidine kinase
MCAEVADTSTVRAGTDGAATAAKADARAPSTQADRLHRILSLALALSGAGEALLVLADGSIAASVGASVKGVDDALLARASLDLAETVVETDPARAGGGLSGLSFFAAAPILEAGGSPLGVLAVASDQRLTPPPGLEAGLEDLAVLAADELIAREGLAEEERQALAAEIDHRVRNVLAAVQSMASQSARRAGSLDGFMKAFSGRLKAMASAHELLTATRGRGASIHDLATGALSTLAPGQTRWEGPELFLTPRAATALSLALHELAVNAVKHGSLLSETGQVDVRWRLSDNGGFELDWVESGGRPLAGPAKKGFGRVLLEEVAGRELEGEVHAELRASGLRAQIKASPNALAAPDTGVRAERVPLAAGPSAIPPPQTRPRRVEGMRVVIVEDAILLAMELEAGLAEAGAEVVGTAALVEEAMRLVDLPIDAAVLDCNLNGLSVEPVAEALAARGVPFLFATGYGEARGAPEGFDAPIIRKPYDIAQITAALAEITRKS